MIRLVCDTCAAEKRVTDVWLLGLAAESLGRTQSRRELTLLPAWDNTQALHPLAVHFCSIQCKDEYLTALFGEDAAHQASALKTRSPGRKKPRPSAFRHSRRRQTISA